MEKEARNRKKVKHFLELLQVLPCVFVCVCVCVRLAHIASP